MVKSFGASVVVLVVACSGATSSGEAPVQTYAGCVPDAHACDAPACGKREDGCGGVVDCGTTCAGGVGVVCSSPATKGAYSSYCCKPDASGIRAMYCRTSDGCGGQVFGTCFYGTCDQNSGVCKCSTSDAAQSAGYCHSAARPRYVVCAVGEDMSGYCTATQIGSTSYWCCP